jgi:hypothetical protein
MLEPEITGADGTVRKAQYGDGVQPWDIIKERGWAPEFAAGNVLKYLRRRKTPDEDRKKARWYWVELRKLEAVEKERAAAGGGRWFPGGAAVTALRDLLRPEEMALLEGR